MALLYLDHTIEPIEEVHWLVPLEKYKKGKKSEKEKKKCNWSIGTANRALIKKLAALFASGSSPNPCSRISAIFTHAPALSPSAALE